MYVYKLYLYHCIVACQGGGVSRENHLKFNRHVENPGSISLASESEWTSLYLHHYHLAFGSTTAHWYTKIEEEPSPLGPTVHVQCWSKEKQLWIRNFLWPPWRRGLNFEHSPTFSRQFKVNPPHPASSQKSHDSKLRFFWPALYLCVSLRFDWLYHVV